MKVYWICSVVVVGFLVLTPETREIVAKVLNGEWDFVNTYDLALYLVTGILIGIWIWSTRYELALLCEWLTLDNYVPPSGFIEAVICILYAIFGGLLFLSVENISWYTGLFTTYSLFNVFIGGIHTLSEVGGALNSSQQSLENLRNIKGKKSKYEIQAYVKALKAIRLHWAKNLEDLQLSGRISETLCIT